VATVGHLIAVHQPQQPQGPHWPPVRGALGGIADHQAAAGSEQGGGALGDHGRGPEGTGGDGVGLPPPGGVPARLLGPLVAHLHTVGEAEFGHGPPQEVRPAALGVEQQPAPAGAVQGDGEGGEATAGPQVDGGAGPVAEGLCEGAGVG
jgi:hypothetical protein